VAASLCSRSIGPTPGNSLSEGLIAELHAALTGIHDDASVRAVVIAANGPAFSAGHDMKELTRAPCDADRGRGYFAKIMTACSAMMQAIVQLPKPVVAAVQGVANRSGCQLVASCDLAVASEAATFATPGVDIGLFCSTPWLRCRAMCRASKRWKCCSPASRFRRRRRGISPRQPVVAAGTERDAAIALAQKVALKSAIRSTRQGRVLPSGRDEPCGRLSLCGRVMTENMMAHDAEEGIGAFIEKREPKWQDR